MAAEMIDVCLIRVKTWRSLIGLKLATLKSSRRARLPAAGVRKPWLVHPAC